MPKAVNKSTRGPMVHIRLDEATHRNLKVLVARKGTTIQDLVEGLIRQKLTAGGSKSKIEDMSRQS